MPRGCTGGRGRWRAIAAIALSAQLVLLCADTPQAWTWPWSWTPTPTEAPMPTETPEVTETPVPTMRTPVPTIRTPVPTIRTPVPTTRTPVPTTKTPEPTTKMPVPTTEAPVPMTKTPETTTPTPTQVVEAASAPLATVAASSGAATDNTAFVCTAEALATLEALSDGNAYLQSTCNADGGAPVDYEFPVSGKLAYAQMVSMSRSSACQVYFLAVLLVEAVECEVAGVFVRSTAEAILALSLEAGAYPSDSAVDAAVAARAAEYTTSSPSTSSTSSSSLAWTLPSASALQQRLGMGLLINADLQIVGTAYSGSDDGEQAGEQVAADSTSSTLSESSSSSRSSRKAAASAWAVAAVVAVHLSGLLSPT